MMSVDFLNHCFHVAKADSKRNRQQTTGKVIFFHLYPALNAGKPNSQEIVVMSIAATHNCDVLGSFQTRFENGSHRPYSDGVIATKNAIRPGMELKQLFHAFLTCGVTPVVYRSADYQIFRLQSHAAFPKSADQSRDA